MGEETDIFKEELRKAIIDEKYDQALTLLEDRVKNSSYDPDVLLTLASVHFKLSKYEEAIEALRRILNIDPEHATAIEMTGILMGVIGTRDSDLSLLNRSILYNDKNYDSWMNKAILEYKNKDFLSAVYSVKKAIELDSSNFGAFYLQGEAFIQMNLFQSALQAFKKAIEMNPAHMNCLVYLLTIYERMGDIANTKKIMKTILGMENVAIPVAVVNRLGEDLLMKGDYFGSRAVLDKYKKGCDLLWRNALFYLQYHPTVKGKELLKEHMEWNSFYMETLLKEGKRSTDITKKGKGKCGIISSDIRLHSVAFFAKTLVESLPDVVIYSTGSKEDYITKKFKEMVNVSWRDCFNKTADEIASIIRSDEIDILFDLNGHTGDNRLDVFALKPAPIQISYIGYPCTTGLETIDYRIVDNMTDPILPDGTDYQSFCSEKLIRLPRCFLCFTPLEFCRSNSFLASLDKTRESLKKARGNTIHIACFNNVRKITDDDLLLWKVILKAHKNVKIFLKDKLFGTPEGREFFLSRCEKLGLNIGQLSLSYVVSEPSEHLLQYNNMDFAIDPIHYNGTTTTCEAMIMGVPIVVHYNPQISLKHASNVGGSLLNGASTLSNPSSTATKAAISGIRNNICSSQWNFIERCRQLIENPSELQAVSGEILSNTVAESALCSQKDFVEDFSRMISRLF